MLRLPCSILEWYIVCVLICTADLIFLPAKPIYPRTISRLKVQAKRKVMMSAHGGQRAYSECLKICRNADIRIAIVTRRACSP